MDADSSHLPSSRTPAVTTDRRAARCPPPDRWGFLREALLVTIAVLLTALIGLVDYRTGPDLSFGSFYLLPVVLCAWWGGVPHGIFLALAGAITWHAVDHIENPAIPLAAAVWNGLVRFGTLTLTSSLISRLRASIRRERMLARTDPLTGAANARTFYEAATLEQTRREPQPLTLAYFDLDNFKQLNDRLGHAAGDEALVQVVRIIRAALRKADLLARLGGDEFALLLPDMAAPAAAELLFRVQGALEREMVRRGWPVTLSIGAITFLGPRLEVDTMLQRVDTLMYDAKRKGKGRIEHTVVHNRADDQIKPWAGPERRATTRTLCNRMARLHRNGPEDGMVEFATIRDLSAMGVGLLLDQALPVGSLVVVEPLRPGAKTLLARVVRAVPDGDGWMHGCVLATRLDEDEMHHWLEPGQAATLSLGWR